MHLIQHLFEMEIFCNIVNVFFDQFNASSLNKSNTLLNGSAVLN